MEDNTTKEDQGFHSYLDKAVGNVNVTYSNMGNLRASPLRKKKSFSPANAPVYISYGMSMTPSKH